MIKNFETLADRLKGIKIGGEDITPEKLIEAIKGENEIELSVSKVNLFTDEQLNDLQNNVKKSGYEEGKTAGTEMTIKELKKKWNIEKEGKSIESLYGYVNEKVLNDAKLPLDEKVKELNTSLTSLQQKYQSDTETWQKQLSQKDGEIKSIKNEYFLGSIMPKLDGYKTNHLIAAFKSDGYSLQYDEEKNMPYITLNGNAIKDPVQNYETPDKVLNSWLQSTGFGKQSQGRGGGNEGGGAFSEFKTEQDMFKYLQNNKIDPSSKQGEEIINKFFEGKK